MLYNYRFTFSFLIAIPAILFLCLFEETKNWPEIIIYNKTGYQLDSLEFEEHYFQLALNDSIIIKNCKSFSMQDDLPFGFPQAKIKGISVKKPPFFICGAGVSKIVHGTYQYDIILNKK
ncbi:hypothetical protein [Flectobacillus roseus]|uniref:Uncharacterized protein n=1 Tax=Flectobacillus roseus TaxID=502259 RepID=A0ABT6Y3L1_9BACT|nr:hypothetical protein [Flectobacillus roseus]MDI9858153.1 hypothetical protein [Flectobacillus roseus]